MSVRRLSLLVLLSAGMFVQLQSSSLDGGLQIEIRRDPLVFLLKDGKGNILTEGLFSGENPAVTFGVRRNSQWDRIVDIIEMDKDERTQRFRAVTQQGSSIQIEIARQGERLLFLATAADGAEAIRCSFRAYPREHFSGMGQRFNSLNLRGQEIPTYDQDWTVPIPFFISSRKYGVYVETDGKFTFDFCTRDTSVYSFWVEQASLSVSFFHGSSPKEIVKQYTALTGRMMRPPSWQFGVWKWRDWVFDETELYQDATMLSFLDIPASVILIDSPWSKEYIDFELNPKQFPEPRKLLDDLHRLRYRVVLWIVPFVNPSASNYAEADSKGYFAKDSAGKTYQVKWWIPSGSAELGLTTNGRGGMIDFTNPDAVKWWQTQIAKVVDLGVDGFKMDDCEQLPDDAYLANGKRGYEMKNYPLLYVKTVHELMRERRGEDFVLMPRAGSAGSQKYVQAFWAADQSPDFKLKTGLPSVIRGGQSMGLVGFPFWGSDVGGYQWAPTKEVFARWIQFGAFSPLMEVGGKSHHEPWLFDDEFVQIFRRYAQLHTYLYPYLSFYVDEALRDGVPLMRPLFLEFPDDERAYREEFEYMFGGELLVAPIYQPGNSRSMYLPEGTWLDFWSLEALRGKRVIDSYRAPLDKIPLFVRVSPQAITRLYRPLFDQQAQGFRERVEFYLQGEKKTLLVKPAQELRDKLDTFLKRVALHAEKVETGLFEEFSRSVTEFKRYLEAGMKEGSIPFHVQRTLTERLDSMMLTAKGIVTLDSLIKKGG